MDRSAALLERAKGAQARNREIDKIIAELQSVSLEPRPASARRPLWVSLLLAGVVVLTSFVIGIALGRVLCL
jgi:hypothetical protein